MRKFQNSLVFAFICCLTACIAVSASFAQSADSPAKKKIERSKTLDEEGSAGASPPQDDQPEPEISDPEAPDQETPSQETSDQEAPTLPAASEKKPEQERAISDIKVPDVSYDLQALPFPTRRMHELILEATKSGEIDKLRALIGIGDTATQLSLGGFDGDAIDFLKSLSGDDQGHEILAILEEVLEAGYVHLDKGTDRELYVWPYFFALPIDKLTDKQRVELFRIVTYGDFLEFKDFGSYIFYRVGISPTGRWEFFVAGD